MGGVALEQRVERAAEAALAQQRYVSAIDVLLGLGWLAPPHLDAWRQGRVQCLERVVQASLPRQSTAMRVFRRWAQRRGLVSSETGYVARTRDRRPLRFSVSGAPEIERAYRTHWVSPELSAAKRDRLAERQDRPPELVVISPSSCPQEMPGSLVVPTEPASCPRSWSDSAAVASATSAKGCSSSAPRSPRRSRFTAEITEGRSGPGQSFSGSLSVSGDIPLSPTGEVSK